MQTVMLVSILDDLNNTSSDIEASAIISIDGLTIASALPDGHNEDRIGAMCAAMLCMGDRTAQDLIGGGLEQVLIKGAMGYVMIVYAGNQAGLTVLTKSNAKLGLIFIDVKRAAESAAKVL